MDCHEIHKRLWSIEDDFSDSLTVHPEPPPGQNLNLSRKTCQHQLDGLAQNFVQTFMVPRRWTLITLAIPDFPSSATMGLTLSDIYDYWMDGP